MPELYYNQYAHEFKLAYQNGMLGLDIDGPNNSWGTVGLNLYVMGRLVVDPERPVAELVEEYCAAFGAAAPAEGAFYSYVDASKFSNNTMDLCFRLLNEAGVAATPGADFDRVDGSKYMRFSYAGTRASVEEAIQRMEKFFSAGS